MFGHFKLWTICKSPYNLCFKFMSPLNIFEKSVLAFCKIFVLHHKSYNCVLSKYLLLKPLSHLAINPFCLSNAILLIFSLFHIDKTVIENCDKSWVNDKCKISPIIESARSILNIFENVNMRGTKCWRTIFLSDRE